MVLRIELDMYIMFAIYIYIDLYRFRLFNAIRHDLPSVEVEVV